jgi:hypothetical protein
MTRLEDVLRETLAVDAAHSADPAAMTRRVRDGVRRRRTARARAVAASAAAVLAAIVAFVGLRGHDGPPSPAPRPVGIEGLDQQPWPEDARYVAVGGQAVFAVVVDAFDCKCAVLHRYQDGAWHRVHAFDTWAVASPVFAPDGRHGWLQVDNHLQSTDDAGEHWAPVELPGLPAGDSVHSPVLLGDEAWLSSESGRLWRVRVGGGGEPVTVPGVAKARTVLVVGKAVVVISTDGHTKVSTDRGRTWTNDALSCDDGPTASAGDGIYLTCASRTLYRWKPGSAPVVVREDVGDLIERIIPLADGRIALSYQHGATTVLQPDGRLLNGGQLPEALLAESVTVGKVTYLGTSDGVFKTTDGRAWELTDPNAQD